MVVELKSQGSQFKPEFQHFVSVTPLDISGVALGTKALMLNTGSGDISSHISGDRR